MAYSEPYMSDMDPQTDVRTFYHHRTKEIHTSGELISRHMMAVLVVVLR